MDFLMMCRPAGGQNAGVHRSINVVFFLSLSSSFHFKGLNSLYAVCTNTIENAVQIDYESRLVAQSGAQ